MIKTYCKLVRKAETKGYSKIISQAIHYIHTNYQYPIKVKGITDCANVIE